MKVLIVKRDKIGDLLLTTPMLRQLRKALPRAEIHLLANDYNAWVVKDNPDIDRLWIYRRTNVGNRLRMVAALSQAWQMVRLRRERFDFVVAANGDESRRAIKRALLVKGARCIAYCADPKLRKRLTDPLPPPTRQHEVDRLLALLQPIGIDPDDVEFPQFVLPDIASRFAQGWLADRRIAPHSYAIVGMGARMQDRQPTAAQVLRWSAYLKEHYGLDTVFMWTPGASENPLYPGDDAIARPVLDAKRSYIHPFPGSVPFVDSLMRSLGLIWSASFSIFPDSGLMHFAAASPGGVLGLFSDKNLALHTVQWAPRGPKANYLEAPSGVPALEDGTLYDALLPILAADLQRHTSAR